MQSTQFLRGAAALSLLLASSVVSAQQRPAFTTAQTISDGAQRTTIAFAGLGMMTGSLEAQSFFPPGKVADYTGFQYLRDNDPDGMGHNTSFLTRVANNVIYILNDAQFAQLKTLATAQLDQINLYGYKRFPLMKAFRRLMEGDIPSGSTGLSLAAVKKASRELYLIDGQISFDRALLYANVLGSMDATQKAYLDRMKGKGWKSWPNITDEQIRAKMMGLPRGASVAVMTYASDLFSWYAGSVEADVYFCPERHGTYYGSFYIKDAPAVGHEGYSINEQLTATAGAALSDSKHGYVTDAQAALMSSLVDSQRNNLYAGATNILGVRTQIATLLRSLLTSTASSASVRAQALELSGTYGELDGENNYHYATVFAQIYKSLTTAQKTKLAGLRKSIMSGTYADGTAFDYSVCTTPFLYSSVITDQTALAPYLANTDDFFFDPAVFVNGASFTSGETASGAIMAVFSGRTLASATAQAGSAALPTTLANAAVQITDSQGTSQLCGLYFVSPHQINFVLPTKVALRAATIAIRQGAATATSGQVTIAAVAPGLFTLDGSAAAITALRVGSNGRPIDIPVTPVDLGAAGDQVYLSLYGTGIRGFSSLTEISATIAGAAIPVMWAGAQGGVSGLDQVNIGPLPRTLAGKGTSSLILKVDGKTANTVTVSVR